MIGQQQSGDETEKMPGARKTLTEISNSGSFGSRNGAESLLSAAASVKYGAGRSRSPSPSFQPLPSQLHSNGVRELHGYVGFANIPNQVYRKAVKAGFHLNLMVVGAGGLGKSTFVNSLFLAALQGEETEKKGGGGETTTVAEEALVLKENGVTLHLTLVDTPGFGDAIDNSACWEPLLAYVERKYADYFAEETKVERAETIPDGRVHVCLYFIAPSGHGLKPLDVQAIKALSARVNVVPVIAKADTLTPDELLSFKARVRQEIKTANIRVYNFPDSEGEEKETPPILPFAVIGSNGTVESGGRRVRARRYPWGIVEVENPEHNDFIALRKALIRSHLMDLVDVTRCVHYENFRVRQLTGAKGSKTTAAGLGSGKGGDPFTALVTEKAAHAMELGKRESEMERVFQEKVKEKEARLATFEREQEAALATEKAAVEELKAQVAQQTAQVAQLRLQHPNLKPFVSGSSLLNESVPPWFRDWRE